MTRITMTDVQRIAEYVLDAQQLLVGVADLERHIADILGVPPEGAAYDAISDLVAGVGTLETVLAQLGITVDEAR